MIQGRETETHVETWGKILALSVGSVAGVNARYWLGAWINRWASSQFPWATLSINVSGAFAIGFLTALLARWSPHSYLRLPILVGFLVGLKSHTKDEETVEIFRDLHLEKSKRVIKPLFEGIRASANPAYQGNERRVDPEEAYVTSLSSCPMLTFLAIACKKRFTVEVTRIRRSASSRRTAHQAMGVQAIHEIQHTTQAPRCLETSAGQSLVRSGRHSGRPG
jgi:fluoride ion exporter CrcB/FEX